MRLPVYSIVFCLCLAIYGTASCATMIESKEADTAVQTQKTWVKGNQLRVETGEQNQYMLMNFGDRTMYLVNEDRQTVLDMSKLANDHATDQSAPNRLNYKVEKKGNGPEIAGFDTEHYVVLNGNVTCLETYTSTQATSSLNLQDYISGMNEMFPEAGSLSQDDDPCRFAETALQYEKIGIPLRIIENGIANYTVTRLEKDADVPADWFSIPKGYQIIDYSQMVLKMMQDKEK